MPKGQSKTTGRSRLKAQLTRDRAASVAAVNDFLRDLLREDPDGYADAVERLVPEMVQARQVVDEAIDRARKLFSEGMHLEALRLLIATKQTELAKQVAAVSLWLHCDTEDPVHQRLLELQEEI